MQCRFGYPLLLWLPKEEETMKTLKFVPCAAPLAITFLLTSCESANAGGGSDIPAGQPLGDLFEDDGNAFDKGMIQTGISDTLREEGPYTLYIPDSDAFARVLKEARLTEEAFLQLDNLEKILGYYVAVGIPDILDYKAGKEVETLAGPTLKLHATDTEHASVNGIRLTSPLNDFPYVSNGNNEVIGGLLLLPGVSLP